MRYGLRHPLDLDLADLASDLVEPAQREELEQHLSECLLCRIKLGRLRDTLGEESAAREPARSGPDVGEARLRPRFVVPRMTSANTAVERAEPGEIWAAGDEERVLLLVIRRIDDRVLVAPVTFDALSADDETVVVGAELSPFDMSLAVYPMLAAELPASLLGARFGELAAAADIDRLLAGSLPGTARGESISGPTDPRLECRQVLVDTLGALEEVGPDPDSVSRCRAWAVCEP